MTGVDHEKVQAINLTSLDALPINNKFIPELQSIRGLAALIVAFGHPLSYYAPPDWYAPVWSIVNSQAAVTIFFVLSGFVLARSLESRPIVGHGIRDFYIKRLFRIYPALWFMSVFALLYVVLLHYRFPDPYAAEWFKGRFQAERFTFTHIAASFAGMLAYLSPPVWTIFNEMLASVLMPFWILLFLWRPSAFWLLIVLLASVGIFFNDRHLYYHFDVYLVDFALGAAMTRLPAGPVIAIDRLVPLKLLVVIAATLMLFTRSFLNVDLYDFWLAQWEALLAVFILFVFGRCGVSSPFLQSREIVWLGDISYSLYIMHFTVMVFYAKAILLIVPNLVPTIGGGYASLLLAILTVATALPLAGWTFRHVEQPGINFGKRLVDRFSVAAATEESRSTGSDRSGQA